MISSTACQGEQETRRSGVFKSEENTSREKDFLLIS
jgi:hypothetical protein